MLYCPKCGNGRKIPMSAATRAIVAAPRKPYSAKKTNRLRIAVAAIFGSFFLAMLMLLIIANSGAFPAARHIVGIFQTRDQRAKIAIRQYLRDNSQSGEWEEVKWWPSTPSRGGRMFMESAKGLGLRRANDEWYDPIDVDGDCFRLTLRMPSALGKSLHDWTFVVDKDSKIVLASETIDVILPGESIADQQKRLKSGAATGEEIREIHQAAEAQENIQKFMKGVADGELNK